MACRNGSGSLGAAPSDCMVDSLILVAVIAARVASRLGLNPDQVASEVEAAMRFGIKNRMQAEEKGRVDNKESWPYAESHEVSVVCPACKSINWAARKRCRACRRTLRRVTGSAQTAPLGPVAVPSPGSVASSCPSTLTQASISVEARREAGPGKGPRPACGRHADATIVKGAILIQHESWSGLIKNVEASQHEGSSASWSRASACSASSSLATLTAPLSVDHELRVAQVQTKTNGVNSVGKMDTTMGRGRGKPYSSAELCREAGPKRGPCPAGGRPADPVRTNTSSMLSAPAETVKPGEFASSVGADGGVQDATAEMPALKPADRRMVMRGKLWEIHKLLQT